MIREAKDDEDAQETYLSLLRSWFKNISFTDKAVAAAYMTGILPIKKDGSQSAISDFREFSMLDPGEFAEYFGFTEKEVMDICAARGLNYEAMKRWYDGYTIGKSQPVITANCKFSATSTPNNNYPEFRGSFVFIFFPPLYSNTRNCSAAS